MSLLSPPLLALVLSVFGAVSMATTVDAAPAAGTTTGGDVAPTTAAPAPTTGIPTPPSPLVPAPPSARPGEPASATPSTAPATPSTAPATPSSTTPSTDAPGTPAPVAAPAKPGAPRPAAAKRVPAPTPATATGSQTPLSQAVPPPPPTLPPDTEQPVRPEDVPPTPPPRAVDPDATDDGAALDVDPVDPLDDVEFLEADAEPTDAERLAALPLPPLLRPDDKPVASEDRPWFAIKVFMGLMGLLALAYLGGHPWVQRLERKIGVSRVVAAGFPFLALGLLAHRNDILTDDVLGHLRPVLHLALGWIGLVIGMRIELAKLSSLPRGALTIVGVSTGLPLAMILAGCGALLLGARALAGQPLLDLVIVRDALIIAAAGAIAADTETLRYGARKASPEARRSLVQLANLDELAALVGLAFLNAYFRPTGFEVTWQLPNTAWLFVTFGLALVVGVVVYAIVRLPATRTESIALLLGSVAFASGIASELHLSPLVVCFVVGLLLTNFPGDHKKRLVDNLARLEMPIYLVFLIVAGAMWSPNLLGWMAMIVLLAARYLGRWAGGRIVWNKVDDHLPADARRSLVFAPMGTLPIAVAVNAALLYPDGDLSTILTATIGGAILCELALALLWRRDELAGTTDPAKVPR